MPRLLISSQPSKILRKRTVPTVSALAMLAVAGLATPIAAQTALPGIVVQGASLEQRPVRRRAPQSSTATTTAPTPAPGATSSAQSAPQEADDASEAVEQGDALVAGVPLRQIGSAVTVIESREIERQQARTAADILRNQPGVTITQQGSVGALTQIRLRGEDSKYTRVLIDGIDASTTKDGAFDLSILSAEEIERIEIVRGPLSALYGPGTVGGVVNVITRRPQGPASATLRVEGGSFGTRDIAARLGGGSEAGYLSVKGQWRDVRGFNITPQGFEKDGTRLGTFGVRAGVALGASAMLEATLRHTEKRAEYDDFGADFVTPPAQKPFHTADDAANVLRQRQTLAGLRLAWDSFGGALTQAVRFNYNNDVSRNRFETLPGTPFFFPPVRINNSNDVSTRTNYGYNVTWRVPGISLGRHVLSGLVERGTEAYTPFSDFSTMFGNFNGDGVKRERNRFSFAGEWRGVFADRLSVTAGARHDINDTFKDTTTWRLALSHDLREWGLRPHASIGTAVKLPGMYDQFGPNADRYRSNPNLKPERGFGYDIGLEQRYLGGRFVLDTTYFNSRLEDRIALNGFDPVTSQSFPINLEGVSKRQGVEISANYHVTQAFMLGLAYTYTDARTPEGAREWRRVPHGLRATAGYGFHEGRGQISVSALYNSRTPDVVFANPSFARSTLLLDNYWRVDMAASYKITPQVELYGRLENAFNAKYQEVYGYNTAGFGAYAGVKVRLGPPETASGR